MSAVARPAITGAAVLNENAANGSGKRLQALNHRLGYDDPIFELMNRGAIEIGCHPAGLMKRDSATKASRIWLM